MRADMGEIVSAAAAFSAVVVTGHELDDLAKWANRFLVLKDGVISSTITAVGAPPEAVRAKLDAALRGAPPAKEDGGPDGRKEGAK
jgi:ABC-type uncharacterized transport system ATPase subunit